MTTPLDKAALAVLKSMNTAMNRKCFRDSDPCRHYPGCGCALDYAKAAISAFINDPHLSISYECRETLRAHLGQE